jgi:hypothetical protein
MAKRKSSSINRVRQLIACGYLCLSLASSASPQSVAKNDRELKQQQQTLHAISMIEQTAGEAPLWDDHKSAVRVLADAADLLWDQKPGQSSKWLTRAWELIAQVSDAPKDERLKDFFTRSERTELRTAVLTVAHKHDRQLAEKFLKELAQQEPGEKKDRGAFDNRTARSEQLLQMAQQIVDTNPELAVELASGSLVDGISYGLQNILTTLRSKNQQLANRLFDLALARFNSGQPDAAEGQVLAGYLFQSGYTFGVNPRGQTVLAVNPLQQSAPPVAASEPQRARAFLVAVFEKLISVPFPLDTSEGRQRAQPVVMLGSQLSGPYRTYAPDLAASAAGLLAQLRGQLFPESVSAGSNDRRNTSDSPRQISKDELYEKTVSELEEKAGRETNPAFKKIAYLQAALAVKKDDYARAKAIAEKIDDAELRADAISFFLYRAALSLIQTKQTDKAIELAPQIGDVARRAVVKLTLAQQLLATRRQSDDAALIEQRTMDLLIDVGRDLAKQEPTNKIARLLLGRVAVLAKLDRDQALSSLQETTQIINKLEAFDLRETGAPDFGLNAMPAAGATVDRPRIGFSFRNAIDPLIEKNFEEVAASAERFAAKELRGTARLEAAKLYLRAQTKPPAPSP